MEQILLIVHVFIAVALIGVVLVQRSEQDGFGLGSGSGSNLLSGRQTANLFTRATAILATAFMVNCLVLGILASQRHTVSFVDQIEAEGTVISVPDAEDGKIIDDPDTAPMLTPTPEPSAPQVPVAE